MLISVIKTCHTLPHPRAASVENVVGNKSFSEMQVRMYVRTYICRNVGMCVYVCMDVRMCVCIYVCMYYVRMYVCTYVCSMCVSAIGFAQCYRARYIIKALILWS